MVNYTDIMALRNSIIKRQGHLKKEMVDDDIAMFSDVSKLNLPYDARKVNIAIFSFLEEGEAFITVDSRQIEFRKGQILTVFPGQTIQIQHLSANFRGNFLIVNEELHQQILNTLQDIVPLFLYMRQHPAIELSQEDEDWLISFATLFAREYHSTTHIFHRQTKECMISTAYYKLSNIYSELLASSNLRNNRQEDLFVSFIQELEKSFRMQREVSFYAERLHVTPKYLSTVVKSVSGKSAGACIDSYVIEEAKMLLRTTRKSVQEVSTMLNFPNQSFFGKYFRRLTNMSPNQYRKSLR